LVIGLIQVFLGLVQVHPADSDSIKIGAMGGYSGRYAMWSIPMTRGIELMANKINSEGGIRVGGKTHSFELIWSDDKTNVEAAVAQVNKLVYNDGVKYITGPGLSAAILAVQPITEKNKVLIMPLGFSPKILGPDKPYSFRLYAVGEQRTLAIYDYLRQHQPDAKRYGLLGPNDESGWGTSAMAKKYAEEKRLEVVSEEFVERGTTDFFPVLTKMLLKKPDALLLHSIPPGDTSLLLQQARQMGFKGLIVSPSLYDTKLLIEKAGAEAVEGFIFQSPDFTGPRATPTMRSPSGVIPLASPSGVRLWIFGFL
jgi:branched-chain amino acid transport system substrate-binding protein